MLLGLRRRTQYKLWGERAARGQVFDRYLGKDRMPAVDRALIHTQEQTVPLWVARRVGDPRSF